MKLPAGLKPGDFAVLVLSITLTAGSFLWVFSQSGGTRMAEVEAEGKVYLYPLDSPRVVEIPGALGPSVIKIGEDGAHFQDSPCSNKLCIHQGPQDLPGEWAACLPNKVFLKIIGQADPEAPDAGTF